MEMLRCSTLHHRSPENSDTCFYAKFNFIARVTSIG